MSRARVWGAAVAALLAAAGAARGAGGGNLIVNGGFDNPTNGLAFWKTEFKLEGESWYADNENFVAAVPTEAGRAGVLRLTVPYSKAMVPGQGVKVESKPVPFDGKAKYRFSATAKSTYPNCRIMLEGYKWRPGIKPHPDPDLSELRKCYRFAQLFFNGQQGGDFGGVGKAWNTATQAFPDPKMTDLAKSKFEEIRFVVVHLVGIGCISSDRNNPTPYLFVDEVKLEKAN